MAGIVARMGSILVSVSMLVWLLAYAWAALLAAQGPGTPPAPPPAIQRPAQIPAGDGTGAISGTVIDTSTGRPVPGAIVNLNPQARESTRGSRQMTDDLGRFVFTRLPAFDGYTVSASKAGYTSGLTAGGATRMSLTDGQWLADLKLPLSRLGAIEGAVTDEYGDPVVGAYVRIMPVVVVAGAERVIAGPSTTTDDRGRYRLADLAAGKYVVMVPSIQSSLPESFGDRADGVSPDRAARDGIPETMFGVAVDGHNRLVVGNYPTPPVTESAASLAYPSVFYPAATAISAATPIVLANAETKPGIDFRLVPVPAGRIIGKVDGLTEGLSKLTLRLLPADGEDLGVGGEVATALVAADGTFTFLAVPAGSYLISATRTVAGFSMVANRSTTLPTPGLTFTLMIANSMASTSGNVSYMSQTAEEPRTFWGEARITVAGSDVSGVVVRMQPGAHVAGRILWDGPSQPMNAAFMAVTLDPASRPSLGQVREDFSARQNNTFTIPGVRPGTYFLRPPVGNIESIQWHGEDYTNRPFDAGSQDLDDVVVTLTTRPTSFSGYVRDAQGQIVHDAAVIVVPRERELWRNFGLRPTRLRSARVSTTGEYQFQNLPAGNYVAIAVDAAHLNAWQDPAFLEQVAPGGMEIKLDWDGKETHDLTIVAVK